MGESGLLFSQGWKKSLINIRTIKLSKVIYLYYIGMFHKCLLYNFVVNVIIYIKNITTVVIDKMTSCTG